MNAHDFFSMSADRMVAIENGFKCARSSRRMNILLHINILRTSLKLGACVAILTASAHLCTASPPGKPDHAGTQADTASWAGFYREKWHDSGDGIVRATALTILEDGRWVMTFERKDGKRDKLPVRASGTFVTERKNQGVMTGLFWLDVNALVFCRNPNPTRQVLERDGDTLTQGDPYSGGRWIYHRVEGQSTVPNLDEFLSKP